MEQTIYEKCGYKNRMEYLESLANDYGVNRETVLALAQMLGPNEDFDGLINALEEMEDECEWEPV